MAVRTSMTELIRRVRHLVADDAGPGTVWSDNSVEEALDNYRQYIRYAPLESIPSYLPSGKVNYKEFASKGLVNWSDAVQIVDSRYNTVLPLTSDNQSGRWTFEDSYNDTLLISGEVYDVYGSAADLLEVWASSLKAKADIKDRDAEVKRSQQVTHCLDVARKYRSKQKICLGTVSRNDVYL